MKKFRYILGLIVATAISTAAAGQITLDLNAAPGDQGERDRSIKPGETFSVELIAIGGATGMIGFKAELKFDTQQIQFKGFNAGGLMTGAMSMPPKSGPSGVEVNAAIMGGGGAREDGGSLGQLLFEATPTLTATPLELTSASFGSTAGIQPVGVQNGLVKIVNPDAPATGGMHGQSGFQNPPNQGGPPQGTGGPPQGTGGPPQGQNQGFQNHPGGQGQSGFQNPPGQGGRQQGQGQNRGFQNPPRGQGQGQGGQQQGGQGMPPQGQGQSGFQNPGQGQGGSHEPMNPDDVIAKLPVELQPAFKKTMEVERNSERAHLEAELAMLRSVRGTLEQTKQFLAGASSEDQEVVARALMFFHNQDDDQGRPMGGPGGHGGPPPPGMHNQGGRQGGRQGGPGMGMQGGPGMGMPGDANQMVRQMIQEIEQEIQHLEQELKNR